MVVFNLSNPKARQREIIFNWVKRINGQEVISNETGSNEVREISGS